MPTDVVMPQMGESITEGTLTKWLKKVGDTVQRDEPLFEISTDKVDAEIPSPAAGTLQEIKIAEGATVQINTVVAVISDGQAQVSGARPGAPASVVTAKAESAAAYSSATSEPAASPAGFSGDAGSGTDVVMPQMGESITEGTLTKWLKKVGERVERDEPLFEISTDKVDAEIPSPVAGTLTEIKVQEGATVGINTVVAVIGGAGAGSAGKTAAASAPAKAPAAASVPAPPVSVPAASAQSSATDSAGERLRSSPLVRKIAKDNNVDLGQVSGTGSAGRITKQDILGHLEGRARKAGCGCANPGLSASRSSAARRSRSDDQDARHHREAHGREQADQSARAHRLQGGHDAHRAPAREGEVEVRAAQRCEADLHAVHHARRDYGAAQAPDRERGDCIRARRGRRDPLQQPHQHRHCGGVGMGIDRAGDQAGGGEELPRRGAGDCGRCRACARQEAGADEISGGTFTLTNSGIFGEQFGTPIINQPQSAILGIGGLNKEAEVLTDKDGNDSIAIRSIQRFTLGFDHRIVDGADAGKFMSDFKAYLENWSEEIG